MSGSNDLFLWSLLISWSLLTWISRLLHSWPAWSWWHSTRTRWHLTAHSRTWRHSWTRWHLPTWPHPARSGGHVGPRWHLIAHWW